MPRPSLAWATAKCAARLRESLGYRAWGVPWSAAPGVTLPAAVMRRRSFGQDLLCAPFAEIPCALDAGAGFTTGGMFSTFFPRPSWQTDPVHAYLDANKGLPTNLFNASGRACTLACCGCACAWAV